MDKFEIKNHIIAGGLTNNNKQNIEIRAKQISDGLSIHTCNDYSDSLEVIKEASFNLNNKLKIISKIYYNYPDKKHRRFRSLYSQVKEQNIRLGFIPLEWNVQLCCYCSINNLISKNAQNFFERIYEEFGINKVFLEIYPIYNFSKDKIDLLNKFYKGKVVFGVIGYQNYLNRIFRENDLVEYSNNSDNIIFIGILGKGIQNKIFPKNFNEDYFKKNILYLLNNIKINKSLKAITNFSSLQQYENFKEVFLDLQKDPKRYDLGKCFDSESQEKIFYFKNFDQYGGKFSTKQYLVRPKLILHKIKNLIYKFIKFRKVSNNLFG